MSDRLREFRKQVETIATKVPGDSVAVRLANRMLADHDAGKPLIWAQLEYIRRALGMTHEQLADRMAKRQPGEDA